MNELISFDSPEFGKVRSLLLDGEPWFVASDVCAAIEVDRTAVRRLDDDEKGVHLMHTPGGEQRLGIINEFGLYSLILSSRKPEAKAFKRWITHEVIPSIRKYGAYVTDKVLDQMDEHPELIPEYIQRLRDGNAKAMRWQREDNVETKRDLI